MVPKLWKLVLSGEMFKGDSAENFRSWRLGAKQRV
jgi:hypothetical protein